MRGFLEYAWCACDYLKFWISLNFLVLIALSSALSILLLTKCVQSYSIDQQLIIFTAFIYRVSFQNVPHSIAKT